MSDATLAVEPLSQGAADYEARTIAADTVHLAKLGLFVQIRPGQVMAREGTALFIAEYDASTERSRRGTVVTCVGLASDPAGAATDATAQWCLGVLPVLARWRGDHSCLIGTASLSVPSASGTLEFEVVKGPVIERGQHDGGPAGEGVTGRYLSLLSEPLRSARLTRKAHWLECFAIRGGDGSVDATCRLDNRD